jgi:hypothetical protein
VDDADLITALGLDGAERIEPAEYENLPLHQRYALLGPSRVVYLRLADPPPVATMRLAAVVIRDALDGETERVWSTERSLAHSLAALRAAGRLLDDGIRAYDTRHRPA